MPIETELKDLIASLTRVRPSRIKSSTKVLEGLGIDSFAALEILVAIENSFKVKLAEDEILKISTFGDLVNVISHRVGSAKKGHRFDR